MKEKKQTNKNPKQSPHILIAPICLALRRVLVNFHPRPNLGFWEPLPLAPITPETEPGVAAQPMMQDVGPPQCRPHRMLQPAAQNAQARTAPGCLSRKVCTCLQAQCTRVCPCAHAHCSLHSDQQLFTHWMVLQARRKNADLSLFLCIICSCVSRPYLWSRSKIYLAFSFLVRVRPSLSPSHTDDGIVLKHGDEFTASVVSLHGDVPHTKLRIFRIKWDKT